MKISAKFGMYDHLKTTRKNAADMGFSGNMSSRQESLKKGKGSYNRKEKHQGRSFASYLE